MIHSRQPEVAETMVRCLSGPTDTEMRHFSAAASCHADLRVRGYFIPEWEDLPTALPRALAALVPGVLAIPENGWQHDASLVLEQRFTDTVVVPRASPAKRALLRSKGGPLSGSLSPLCPSPRSSGWSLTCSGFSCFVASTFLSHCFFCFCRCGRPLDCLGHHRANYSRAGVLGKPGFVERLAPECEPMCSCVTSTFSLALWTNAGSR